MVTLFVVFFLLLVSYRLRGCWVIAGRRLVAHCRGKSHEAPNSTGNVIEQNLRRAEAFLFHKGNPSSCPYMVMDVVFFILALSFFRSFPPPLLDAAGLTYFVRVATYTFRSTPLLTDENNNEVRKDSSLCLPFSVVHTRRIHIIPPSCLLFSFISYWWCCTVKPQDPVNRWQ